MQLAVLSTNDVHSHCENYEALENLAASIRKEYKTCPSVWCDAGDWFSGTIYSPLGPMEKCPALPELGFYHRNNVITCIGNHEFDATPLGFAIMLEKAQKLGYKSMVSSDIVLDNAKQASNRLLQVYSDDIDTPSVINECILRTIGDISVGFVGVMGPDARRGCKVSILDSGIEFIEWGETLFLKVATLAAKLRVKGASLVIALVHGGKSECEAVLENCEIDFVISGHTHQKFTAEDESLVCQAGNYGKHLGFHLLSINSPTTVTTTTTTTSTTTSTASTTTTTTSTTTKTKTKTLSKPTKPNIRIIEKKIIPISNGDAPSSSSSSSTSARQHPDFNKYIVPLFRQLDNIDVTQVYKLPRQARVKNTRKEHDPFASWFCTVILQELNQRLPEEQQCEGFFIANELLRGDFDGKKTTTLPEIFSCFEIGQASPDSLGVDIVVLETSYFSLHSLSFVFWLAARFYSENAIPAYSHDFFLRRKLRTRVNIATTAFMAKNLQSIPGVLFHPVTVHTVHNASLSLMFRNYLITRNSVNKGKVDGSIKRHNNENNDHKNDQDKVEDVKEITNRKN